MRSKLTEGSVMRGMLLFSLPLMAGNLLQQLYNVADTLLVGRYLGAAALAAVGSAYSLMVFLTSMLLGLCMGSGVVFAQLYGAGDTERLKKAVANAFGAIAAVTALIGCVAWWLLPWFLELLNIQPEAYAATMAYLRVVLLGLPFTFLYNFFASALRSVGDALRPLLFLAVAAVLNIGLDILFIVPLGWGVEGAALATVIAQGVCALLALGYFMWRAKELCPARRHWRWDKGLFGQILSCSLLTGLQQSVMNFGILLVQGLVNSFGIVAMAAFAAGVKVDSFAYTPLQDLGNAFSTFVAQNYGAGHRERIRRGMRGALVVAVCFGGVVSLLVGLFAPAVMGWFVGPGEREVIATGAGYLWVEGAFYPLIGILFLLYGYFRAVGRPGVSLLLTGVSLGTRVALAYALAGPVGLTGVWWAVPIGWALADVTGLLLYWRGRRAALTLGQDCGIM